MYTDDRRRNEIHAAAQRLEAFLGTLEPDDWARQSACEGWTVGDVVAHLVERGAPIPDQIERGLAGDISSIPGIDTESPMSEDQFRLNLDRSAVDLRQRLGQRLLTEFTGQNREFDRVLAMVEPGDWEKLCYHRLRPETVRSKADIRIAELAMHEWDIHWALERDATVAEDSLPGLVNASGRAVRRAFRPDSGRPGPVRYRFDLSGPVTRSIDVVLSAEGASFETGPSENADVVFCCSSSTYAMVIFGRQKLGQAIETGAVAAEGNQKLVQELIAAFVGG